MTVKVAVDDLGVPSPSGSARLTLRRDGEPPVIQDVPIGREVEVTLPITRAGPTIAELQVAPLPGEVSQLNNRTVIQVNGVRDRLRVLLVSGEPHAGERTWRRLLKADPAVDLVHFTILRPPDRDEPDALERTGADLPSRRASCSRSRSRIRPYHPGPVPEPRHPAADLPASNIADYVRQGGGLLLSAGPEFTGPTSLAATPLGGVLPARPTGGGEVQGAFRPQVTALGTRHPVTEGLPGWSATGEPAWGEWYRRINVAGAALNPEMATPDGAPLLLLEHADEGRIAMLLSDQIWLWSRGHEGGGPQAELLRRIAHWLMKEPALEEEALRAQLEDGRLLVDRRTLGDGPPPELTVTAPDGTISRVPLAPGAPGHSTASVPTAAPGVWAVSDGTRQAFAAAADANPRETADLRATATVMSPVVRASGGSTRFIGGGVPELRRTEPGRDSAGAGWIGLPRRHDHVVTGPGRPAAAAALGGAAAAAGPGAAGLAAGGGGVAGPGRRDISQQIHIGAVIDAIGGVTLS